MRTGELGRKVEDRVAAFLKKQGWEIVGRNFRTRRGELDIVARKGRELSFIEVKARSGGTKGRGEESVNRVKVLRIRNAAKVWMQKRGAMGAMGAKECDLMISFWVASVKLNQLRHRVEFIPMEFD